MKILVNSNCRISGQGYTAGEIVDASDELAKEFIIQGRGRKAPEVIAAAPAARVVETAAMSPAPENASANPAKSRRK